MQVGLHAGDDFENMFGWEFHWVLGWSNISSVRQKLDSEGPEIFSLDWKPYLESLWPLMQNIHGDMDKRSGGPLYLGDRPIICIQWIHHRFIFSWSTTCLMVAHFQWDLQQRWCDQRSSVFKRIIQILIHVWIAKSSIWHSSLPPKPQVPRIGLVFWSIGIVVWPTHLEANINDGFETVVCNT